jgi:hypothetical protein
LANDDDGEPIMLVHPALLLASLLVLRSCGYRLVRRA